MLTKIGLDDLEKRIQNVLIKVPCTMNSDQLLGFCNGYKQCEDTVLAIIAEFRETMEHCERCMNNNGFVELVPM